MFLPECGSLQPLSLLHDLHLKEVGRHCKNRGHASLDHWEYLIVARLWGMQQQREILEGCRGHKVLGSHEHIRVLGSPFKRHELYLKGMCPPRIRPPAIAHSVAFLGVFKLILPQCWCSLNACRSGSNSTHDPRNHNTVFFHQYPEMWYLPWMGHDRCVSKELFHPYIVLCALTSQINSA